MLHHSTGMQPLYNLEGMLSQQLYQSQSDTTHSAPPIPKDVHHHFSSISTPEDVEQGKGVLLLKDGSVEDIHMKKGGGIALTELSSPYNRARYIFKAKDAAQLFDNPEIDFFAYTLEKKKAVFPVGASIAVSEKGTVTKDKSGRERGTIAATLIQGIPVWHTDFYRRVAKLAVSYDVSFNDALKYIVHHERRHHAVGMADFVDRLMKNTVRLERRLEKDLYAYFTEMAEITEGEQRQHYLNMAKIAEDRIGKAKKTYGGRKRNANQDNEETLDSRMDGEEQTEEAREGDPSEADTDSAEAEGDAE